MFGEQEVAFFERIRKIGNHLLEEVFNLEWVLRISKIRSY